MPMALVSADERRTYEIPLRFGCSSLRSGVITGKSVACSQLRSEPIRSASSVGKNLGIPGHQCTRSGRALPHPLLGLLFKSP
jgi:hypothetical protein